MRTVVLIVKNLEKAVNRKKSIPYNHKNEKEIESTTYQYFDEELYKQRYVIERANAW